MTVDPSPSTPVRSNGVASSFWVRLRRAVTRIGNRQHSDHVVYLAASLAYFTVLALVPISAISLSVVAALFSEEQDEIFEMVTKAVLPFDEQLLVVKPSPPSQGEVESASTEQALEQTDRTDSLGTGNSKGKPAKLTELHDEFKEKLQGFVEEAKGLGPIGIVFLIITGFWLFDSIEDAFNSIWRVEKRRPFVRRFIIFWAILTLTPLLMVGPVIVNQYVETKVTAFDLDIIWGIVSFLLTWFAIWLLYILVPNGNVAFRSAAISSFAVAFLWEIAKRGFAEYVVRSDSYSTIYGSMSIVLFVLGWIYLTWWLILEGLEFAAYLQYPDWDKATGHGDLAPEISLLYSWGGLYQVGKNFLRGQGGTTTDSVSACLGLDQARVNKLLDRMENKGLLVRNRDGNWYPSLALEQVTWAEVAAKLDYDMDASDISLSEWLDSALRARGLVGYRQETENLPTLDHLLKNRMDNAVLPTGEDEESRSPALVLEPGDAQTPVGDDAGSEKD